MNVQPGYGTTGAPDDKDRQWGMLAHVAPLLVGFVGPLVLMMTDLSGRGEVTPFVKHHAKQSLIWSIALIVVAMLTCGVGGIVMMIWQFIGAMAANRGEWYVYPGLGSFVEQPPPAAGPPPSF